MTETMCIRESHSGVEYMRKSNGQKVCKGCSKEFKKESNEDRKAKEKIKRQVIQDAKSEKEILMAAAQEPKAEHEPINSDMPEEHIREINDPATTSCNEIVISLGWATITIRRNSMNAEGNLG